MGVANITGAGGFDMPDLYEERNTLPVYTYRAVDRETSCDGCRENFDVVQRMDDVRLTACPSCGQTIFRVITGASVLPRTHFGEALTREHFKRGGLRRLVKDDTGKYIDDTPK